MRPELLEKLTALPALEDHTLRQAAEPCKVCGAASTVAFDSVDFNKFCNERDSHRFGLSGVQVHYRRCLSCSYIFTDFFDDWTAEEFSRFIYNSDYIKIDDEYESIRPKRLAEDFSVRFGSCERASILDFGSGAGVFVTRLRNAGFTHVRAYDPFSSPEKPDGRFDIITCFEVIEHSPDPHGTLAAMREYLAPGGCIIFSQTVQPPDILRIRGNWWYLAPRNGHVSTYSEETLLRLGESHGLHLHVGSTIYGFAEPDKSVYANIALRQTPCTSFSIIRIWAPSQMTGRSIPSQTSGRLLWHEGKHDKLGQYRWTGDEQTSWSADWQPVDILEVRVPVVPHRSGPSTADCTLALDGQVRPLTEDRGEWVARFEVAGTDSGTFVLRTPCVSRTTDRGSARGVAIRMDSASRQAGKRV